MRCFPRWILTGMPLLCAAALAATCTPPDPWQFTSTMDIPSPKGEPKIEKVQDLGSVPLVLNKPLKRGGSDGVAVVGELLVIRGKNLGKQPQVMFGTRAMSVLARTADGGIVVRAPAGATPGKLSISVSHGRGASSYPMELRRYGLAIVPGLPGVRVLEVGASRVVVLPKPLLATAPSFVELDRHGTVAFVTTGGKAPRLLVIDLAAAGGPREVTQRGLGQWKVLGLAVASRAKRAVVVHEKAILIFDLEDPRDPLRFNPARFPKGVLEAEVVDVKLSPDGRTLAVLVKRNNSVVLFDVSDPNQVRNTAFISLLPGAKEPQVRSIGFTRGDSSSPGQVLWVATGDTPRSQLVGKHPPRLLKYAVTSAPDRTVLPTLKRLAALALPGKRTPLAVRSSWAVAQVASSAALRREPSKITIFASMLHPDLFTLARRRLTTPTGLQQGAELLRHLGKFGTILRLNHRGEGASFHKDAALYSSMQVTGDGKLLLASGCRPDVSVDPPKVEIPCGLLVKPIDSGASKLYVLGRMPLASFAPPFRLGVVRVQP